MYLINKIIIFTNKASYGPHLEQVQLQKNEHRPTSRNKNIQLYKETSKRNRLAQHDKHIPVGHPPFSHAHR